MIGSVGLATKQGLGYLLKDFYDNGIINKVLLHRHTDRTNHYEWYKEEDWRTLSKENYEWFLDGLSALIIFETPFSWDIVDLARNKGIKTILIPMYECTIIPPRQGFDFILSPSLLDQKYYPESSLITIPNSFVWKLRKKANVFVHNAGNLGLGGRNGTKEVLEAMQYVKSPIKLIIRHQKGNFTSSDSRISFEGEVSRGTLYKEGDVFLFPEKFNGLSMPIQEAFASGMMIMCGDRFPMNEWLPKEPLIPVKSYKKEVVVKEVKIAQFDPKDIAKTIDEWYGKDITDFSLKGKEWAETNTWNNFTDNLIEICGL